MKVRVPLTMIMMNFKVAYLSVCVESFTAMFSTYINGLCNIKPMYFPFEKYQCFVNLEFDDFRHEYYMNGIETLGTHPK